MTTGGLIILFIAVMGVAAMMAIGLDWVGKPFRNRKFRPRIYRYPDEHGQRILVDPTATGHSAAAFELPMAAPQGLPTHLSTGGTDWGQAMFEAPPAAETDTWELLGRELDGTPAQSEAAGAFFGEAMYEAGHGEPYDGGPEASVDGAETISSAVIDTDADVTQAAAPVKEETAAAAEAESDGPNEELRLWRSHITFQRLVEGVSAMPPLAGEWHAGDPIWTVDGAGSPPNSEVAQRRFWQSAAAFMPGTQWYGNDNTDRIIRGEAPQRLNRRTGRVEIMEIDGLDSTDDTRPVRPYWPDQQVDPFQAGMS